MRHILLPSVLFFSCGEEHLAQRCYDAAYDEVYESSYNEGLQCQGPTCNDAVCLPTSSYCPQSPAPTSDERRQVCCSAGAEGQCDGCLQGNEDGRAAAHCP